MYEANQAVGYSLIFWKDQDRPFLEVEAPYRITEDPDTFTFLCFDSDSDLKESDNATRRYIIPRDGISYIETNFC